MSCLLALLLIVSGVFPLCAKTLTFDQEKCHIDVPDDWSEKQVEGNRASFISPDQTKSFTMRIAETGLNITLDNASFIKGFEESMLKNGLTITNRQHFPIADVDAYAVDSTQSVPAGTVYNRMIVFLANGYAYGLNISKVNAKPSDDNELNGIVNSFAFIGAPQLHKSEDPMERVGFYIGVFVALLAVISCVKWLRRKSRPLPNVTAP